MEIDQDKMVSVDQRELQKAIRLRASLVSSGSKRLRRLVPESPELVIDVKRITFYSHSSEEELIKRQLLKSERCGKIPVLVMDKDEGTRAYLEVSGLWWGWTLVSQGDVYTIQLVIFEKPAQADLLGEVDQGRIYEMAAGRLASWDGRSCAKGRIAA